VPWKALAETPDKFLELCYLPVGVHLTDISKMKAQTLTSCLLHWSDRVQNGDIAFRFKAVEESHLRVPKSKKKRSAPASEDEADQSSKGDHPSTSTQQKTHPHLASEEEGEESSGGDHPSTQVGASRSVDGDDSDDADEDTGKGKGKHVPLSWYDYIIAWVPQVDNYPTSSPANVPKQVQDQFEYLFSLSDEKEYVQLLKQAADVPVRAI